MSWMRTGWSKVDTSMCGRSRQVLREFATNEKQCSWLNGDGSYIVPQDGAIGRASQAGMKRLIQRTKDLGSRVLRKV